MAKRTEISDEAYVIENMFRIADKEGNDVDFILNDVQRDLDLNLIGRDLVPKARQEGVSSYVLARFTAKCLYRRNTRAVVISHDQESTQRMLRKVKYFLEEIKGPPPKISNMSANEIVFTKTNAMFYIGTAGSRKFGRGDTITDLHCSEYAFWPKPQDLMRGLMQAVPRSGEIIIESTGNGLNDYYHRCMRSYSGNSRWASHFYPWHTFPEYQVDASEEEQEDFLAAIDSSLEEDALLEAGMPVERLMWRREKLEEMDYDLRAFKTEYPQTLDECFQTTGESIFHRVKYEPTDKWKKVDANMWMLDGHPSVYYTYAIGGDVAAGVGRDYSALEVICLETGEQVGEYVNNRIDPEQFGRVADEIGRMFNPDIPPFMVIERNNHGILTLAVLDKLYPGRSLYSEAPKGDTDDKQLMHLGYRQDAKSKPLIIGRLRSALAQGFIVHSPYLNSELSTFIEHENGKMEAQQNCHDDTVIALACAVKGLNEASFIKANALRRSIDRSYKDPFSFDGILSDLNVQADEGFPIKGQSSEYIH